MDRRTFLGALAAGSLSVAAPARAVRPQRRPNVVLIMADDMGYSDTGAYGGEIRTPNIDGLAREGLRFSQFYNCARCVPTRGALMTGVYPHQAGVGDMMGPAVARGYLGQLADECVTIAEALRGAGYRTAMSGKWHLSHLHIQGKEQLNFRSDRPFWDTKATWPVARGFEEFYGTIAGVENYYDPFSLVHGEAVVRPNGPGFYYTDAIADHAARTIAERARAAAAGGAPFFHYVAFTAPHWPLHALPEDVARYDRPDGPYAAGWDAVREARYRRMRELGLIREWALSPRDPEVPAWADAPNKEWQARRMAVYAAMVDRMDRGIGRILAALRDSGAEEDTLVLFLSDNGASQEPVKPEWYDIPSRTRDGRPIRVGDVPSVTPGAEDTWLSYETPWANASNTPWRLYKHFVHEGGISTPLIARWPRVVKQRGAVSHEVGHVIDVMATVLDAAGARYPRSYRGRRILPLEGQSLLPVLRGGARPGHDALYWEHEGHSAVRAGRWKLVSRDAGPDGAPRWELYDLEADRTELHDRAGEQPARVAELRARYDAWARRANVLPRAEYERMLRAVEARDHG